MIDTSSDGTSPLWRFDCGSFGMVNVNFFVWFLLPGIFPRSPPVPLVFFFLVPTAAL